MPLLDHVVVLIEPTGVDDQLADFARETVASGGRVTIILRLSTRFQADVSGFADSEDLDVGMAEELALERIAELYRSMIDPAAGIVLVGDDEKLPLEHPALASATALLVSATVLADERVRAELARSPLPVVVAPDARPEKLPVGAA
jgi:hypothetical protein